MRHPAAALRAELRRTATAKREMLAAELYDVNALGKVMVTAAGAGHEAATVPGPVGLDLRATAAAREAEGWLTSEGLAWRWDTRSGDPAGPAVDLVIEWREALRSA